MRSVFTAILLCFAAAAWAQPINDNCSGLIDLGVAPACPEGVFFTNVGATASDIGADNIPSCFNGGGAQRDVWFAFTASDTLFDYTITVTGLADGGSPAMLNPQIALYRGDCETDGLAELLCVSAEDGESILQLDAFGLTPNVVYFLRINDYSATATPNAGTFQLCVGPLEPVNTIDEGGSTQCFGELYDTGGPDEDYTNGENHTFTICPSQPHGCINFMLQYYNIEPSEFFTTDQLIFYDSDQADPNAIIGQINGFNGGGGGAVCYSVQASSGCLTVQFISDGSATFEGFAGSWQCTAAACEPPVSVAITPNITNDDILDFISTPQTVATITNINCPQRAYGLFEGGDATDLGLGRGLLLTSGDVNLAPGPNNATGSGAINDAAGDPDLDYLSSLGGGQLSNDACIIELDVFASTNELTFEYIFGSEEYPEYVNDLFNDIFAFLISGPGITGDPNIANQLNIAVLPDGNNTPIEINSVNNLINWEYYRNNSGGLSTQYDGLTSDLLGVKKSLTARAQVIPCNTYHLKLAIADRGDFSFDSGVFISELRGGAPEAAVRFNSGIDYLIEDCTNTPDEVVIRLNNAVEDTVSYTVVIGGTATLGLDYLLNLPSEIIFLPGQTEFTFPIQPLSDLLVEPTESITISLTNDFGCGEVVYLTLEIELRDQLVVEIAAGQDTVLVCENGSIVLTADGAATYFWTPPGLFSDPSSPNPTLTPQVSGWVSVVGNVGPICTDTDSVYVQIIAPVIEVTALDPVVICQGDNVRLNAANNVNNQNLKWTPTDGLDNPNSPNPVATPQVTTTYIASVEVAGCIVTDEITIDVSPFEFPQIAPDTTICQNYSTQLAELFDPGAVTTTYSWTPTTSLDDPTLSGPIATPDVTTTYQLIAISGNGACTDTATITVTVLPSDVTITNPDTTEICLGSTVSLTAVTNTGNFDNLVWSPGSTLSDTIGQTVIAQPTVSGWYFATFVAAQCTVFDSAYIRVDSLPLSTLMAVPDKSPYCEGDIVVFTSPTYEPGHFPDIQHLWEEGPGYETGDTLWNMVVTTVDTFDYIRTTINRACQVSDTISINVVEGVPMMVIPSDTTICPGESVQLLLDYVGQGEITWEPAESLSCADCFTPIATPIQTVQYTVKASEGDCVQQATAQITLVPLPIADVIAGFEVCQANVEPVELMLAADPVSTYVWTSSSDPNFTSTDPFVQVIPETTTTYTVTATNQCTSIVRLVQVTVVETVNLESIPDQTVCFGDPAIFSAVTDAPDGVTETFVWSYSNGLTANGNPVTISGLGNTTDVTLTYTYGPGCETLQEVFTVTVIPFPIADVIPDFEICEANVGPVQLMTAADAVSSYTWTSSTDPNFVSTNPLISVTPQTTTTYSVTATNQCTTIVRQVRILVVEEPTLSLIPDQTICLGDPVTFTAVSDAPEGVNEVFTWSYDNQTATGNPVTVSDIDITTEVVLSYTYGPGAGCGTLQEVFTVNVVDITASFVEIEVSRDTIFQGDTTRLTAVVDPVIENATYKWFADGVEISGETSSSIIVQPATIGTVQYSVQAFAPQGCFIESLQVPVVVLEPDFMIPLAFTPNGDNRNDVFRLLNSGTVEMMEFKIYNRWGQVVYESTTNEGWDGTHKGKPAPSDVYVYRMRFKLGGVEQSEQKGDVTLLR